MHILRSSPGTRACRGNERRYDWIPTQAHRWPSPSIRSIRPTCSRRARMRVRARSLRRTAARSRSFNFTPPGGYQFQSNVVDVPLGSREGFFVVEARRGDVGEQVWINRSRVGLLAKATPGSLLLWGVDLGTGMPLARMRVQFVVGGTFATRNDRWRRIAALEPHAASGLCARAVGKQLRLPEPVAAGAVSVGNRRRAHRIGGRSRRRHRARGRIRANASARRAARQHRNAPKSPFVPVRVRLPRTRCRSTARARSVRRSFCRPTRRPATMRCSPKRRAGSAERPFTSMQTAAIYRCKRLPIAAPRASPTPTFHCTCTRRGAVCVVAVTVVRSPHVYVGDPPESTPWATTRWLEASVQTDAGGNAVVAIPHPNDDLAVDVRRSRRSERRDGRHANRGSDGTRGRKVNARSYRAKSGRAAGLLGRRESPRRQSARRRGGHRAARARSVGAAAAVNAGSRRSRARKFQLAAAGNGYGLRLGR